jgi:hypothetical protein
LKGFVPYAGQGREFPHSLEFQYLSVASVMVGPTDFQWTPLERLLDDVASRGCQAVFRFYLEYPGKPTGLPAHLVAAGVELRRWTNTNTHPFPAAIDHTPDYEDPRLRAALTNFIAALGARYDGDPRIGFITAGLLGTWGEWHCHPRTEWFASKAVQAEVMDAYEAAFTKTPVLLRYPAGKGDHAHAPNDRRRFGYHDDSFAWATLETGRKEDGWFFLPSLQKAGPGAIDRWKTAPIGGEIRPELWPCLWTAEGCTAGQDFARSVAETHASWLMESSTSRPMKAAEKERAIAAARSLGYEFQILEARAAVREHALEVSVVLTNRGVAPFYADWPVSVLVVGPDGREISARLPIALGRLLPGQTATPSATLAMDGPPAGTFRLYLGVAHPLRGGKPLRFANVEAEVPRAGWWSLGSVRVP